MKRHLRPSIKFFLIGLVASQVSTYSLSAFNRHLQSQHASLELSVEDYTITHKSVEIKPCSTNSQKTYMDYRTITDKTSDQYNFIKENMEVRKGYLMDSQGYIGVALGSWFGEIGQRLVFTLEDGKEIYVVKVDEKDDRHTVNGCQHSVDGSVIEFVIDKEHFALGDNGYINNGNFNNVEWFNGEIKSLRYVSK